MGDVIHLSERRDNVKFLRKIIKEQWEKIEPYFIEEFQGLILRKLAFGIEASKDEYEKASSKVLTRSGVIRGS